VRSVLAVVAITAIALATIFGGHRYLYCHAMGEVMDSCACATSQADLQSQPSVSALNDCLEARFIDRLSSASVGATVEVAVAPHSALLPIDGFTAFVSGFVAAESDAPIRAGPRSPTAVRAQLMVFLT
jgi:hypothetical protein